MKKYQFAVISSLISSHSKQNIADDRTNPLVGQNNTARNHPVEQGQQQERERGEQWLHLSLVGSVTDQTYLHYHGISSDFPSDGKNSFLFLLINRCGNMATQILFLRPVRRSFVRSSFRPQYESLPCRSLSCALLLPENARAGWLAGRQAGWLAGGWRLSECYCYGG